MGGVAGVGREGKKSLDELPEERTEVETDHQAWSLKTPLQEKTENRRKAKTPQGTASETARKAKCREF